MTFSFNIRNSSLVKAACGVAVLALVAFLFGSFVPAPASAVQFTICHTLGNGQWDEKSVNQSSLAGHLGHGDFLVDNEHPCPPAVDNGGNDNDEESGDEAEACSLLGGTMSEGECQVAELTICTLLETLPESVVEDALNLIGMSLSDFDCGEDSGDEDNNDGGGDEGDTGDEGGDEGSDEEQNNNDSGGSGSSSGGGGGGTPHIAGTPSSTSWNGEGEVLGAETEACSAFLLSYMGLGRNNNPEEVMKLQGFLNGEMGAELPTNGNFDQATEAVVKQFQLKYAEEVLAPWLPYGLPSIETPTGYVYKTTQRMINKLFCNTLDIPMPQLP